MLISRLRHRPPSDLRRQHAFVWTKSPLDDGESDGWSAGVKLQLLGWTTQNGSHSTIEPDQLVNPSNRIVFPGRLINFQNHHVSHACSF
jgi:hypothetical protein